MTYVEAVERKTVNLESEIIAGLFIMLCSGVDQAKGETYRYKYEYPKRKRVNGRNVFTVDIVDYGK